MSRALILMYHQVAVPRSAQEQRFCTPPDEFARQMDHLRAAFVPVSLEALVAGLRGQASLPERAVHVSFDDGFAGVLEHAAPVLQARAIPATLYAVSGRLGGTNDWMTPRGYPERALLGAAQLRELAAAGLTIGSHTCSHARLTELSPQAVAQEVGDSRRALEDTLGRPVRHFAYPYGLTSAAVRQAVAEAGYDTACSTLSGFNRRGEDTLRLRRIDVFGTDRAWQFRQKLRFGRNESGRLYALRYYAARAMARLAPRARD
jgi:peptidoglycan/xylan/chitin deacetylase (PgdA/CDA1 family)